jgi:hypothetical protein
MSRMRAVTTVSAMGTMRRMMVMLANRIIAIDACPTLVGMLNCRPNTPNQRRTNNNNT